MRLGQKVILAEPFPNNKIYVVSGIISNEDPMGRYDVDFHLEPEDVLILNDGETREICMLYKNVLKVVEIK